MMLRQSDNMDVLNASHSALASENQRADWHLEIKWWFSASQIMLFTIDDRSLHTSITRGGFRP